MPRLPKHVLSSKRNGQTVMVRPEDTIELWKATSSAKQSKLFQENLENYHKPNFVEQVRNGGMTYTDILVDEIFFSARGYKEELQRIISNKNHHFNESALYRPYIAERTHHFEGSPKAVRETSQVTQKSLILRAKLTEEKTSDRLRKIIKGLGGAGGCGQTSQPYKIEFDFMKIRDDDNGISNQQEFIMAPVHIFDDDLFVDCAKSMPPEAIKMFFDEYEKMADLSGHDYLHALIVSDNNLRDMVCMGDEENEDPKYSLAIERHALILHAAIMQQSFERVPKRKQKILEYAQKTFSLLGQAQENIEKIENVEEQKMAAQAITALAESYSHCLFRVVSPQDPDLDVCSNSTYPSINEAIEKINIQMNMDMIDEQSGYDEKMSNKEKLLLNLSVISYDQDDKVKLRPGTYDDIYNVDKVAMQLDGEQPREVGIIELLSLCDQRLKEPKEAIAPQP